MHETSKSRSLRVSSSRSFGTSFPQVLLVLPSRILNLSNACRSNRSNARTSKSSDHHSPEPRTPRTLALSKSRNLDVTQPQSLGHSNEETLTLSHAQSRELANGHHRAYHPKGGQRQDHADIVPCGSSCSRRTDNARYRSRHPGDRLQLARPSQGCWERGGAYRY